VLSTLVRYSQELPPNFVTNLHEVRLAMAPSYTEAAVEQSAAEVAGTLAPFQELEDTPEAYAAFDWAVHRGLTILSGNPIYTLMFNGFTGFYEQMARLYFASPAARLASRQFYQALYDAALAGDAAQARQITTQVMTASIEYWKSTQPIGGSR
jgi:GntR family negative regulator for fad regulon and positive regulator of fabA